MVIWVYGYKFFAYKQKRRRRIKALTDADNCDEIIWNKRNRRNFRKRQPRILNAFITSFNYFITYPRLL